jgi:hypothetical protein
VVDYDEYLDRVVGDELNDGRSALTLLQYERIKNSE